jgi:hypothetical protein
LNINLLKQAPAGYPGILAGVRGKMDDIYPEINGIYPERNGTSPRMGIYPPLRGTSPRMKTSQGKVFRDSLEMPYTLSIGEQLGRVLTVVSGLMVWKGVG